MWALSFLYQAVADFEHGLVFMFTESIKTPELDVSFNEPDVISPSVFRVSTLPFLIVLNHGLFLASNVINYRAKLGHYFCWCHLQTKTSKWLYHFFNHPVVFQVWASCPPDNITLIVICAEIRSGLLFHSFARGFYAGRGITYSLHIRKEC